MPLKALLACLVSTLALACGGSSSDSSGSSQTGSGSAAGGPRLAWDQFAPGADELRRYSYVLYVDGTPVPLPGAACGTLAADTLTAACTAPLPSMSPGQHTLEMATRVIENAVVLESAKSAPITYTAGGAVTGSVTLGARAEAGADGGAGQGVDESVQEGSEAASDRPYVVEAVLTGLDRPTALAMLPDGRLLVAERGGVIRVAEPGGEISQRPAAELHDADPAPDTAVSLALAPDFNSSRHVYVAYRVVDGSDEPSGRVIRFREAGGVLGEAAVILDGLPAAQAAPWMAVGPDGALYVGTSSADADEAADVGSHAGKILRFSLDGSTPAGNPWAASPVYSYGYHELRGLVWDGPTGTMWALEADKNSAVLARAAAGSAGTPVASFGQAGRARMAFLAADAAGAPAEWRGSLFVASPAERCLLRVSGLSESSGPAVERLFQGEFGRIGVVLAAEDGLYFATSQPATGPSRGEAWAADAIYRVRGRTSDRQK